jgi:hypothetical protein
VIAREFCQVAEPMRREIHGPRPGGKIGLAVRIPTSFQQASNGASRTAADPVYRVDSTLSGRATRQKRIDVPAYSTVIVNVSVLVTPAGLV